LGLIAVPAGEGGVVLESGVGGVSGVQEDFVFSEDEETLEDEEFEFEGGKDEMDFSPVPDELQNLELNGDSAMDPAFFQGQNLEDQEEFHLELSEMEDETSFDPEADLGVPSGDFNEMNFELPVEDLSSETKNLLSEDELNLMIPSESYAAEDKGQKEASVMEEDLELEIKDETDLSTELETMDLDSESEQPQSVEETPEEEIEEELSEGFEPGHTLDELDLSELEAELNPDQVVEAESGGDMETMETESKDAEYSLDVLDLEDLESDLSDLEEPSSAPPGEEQGGQVFELIEDGEGQPAQELSLEELSKEEIFESSDQDQSEPEEPHALMEGYEDEETLPTVDLDGEDTDLEELAMELEEGLKDFQKDPVSNASDEEMASISKDAENT